MTYTFPASFKERYRAYRTAFHRKSAAWLGYAFFVGLPLLIAALAVVLRGWTVQEIWTQQGYLLTLGPLFAIVGVPLLHRLNVQQQRSGMPLRSVRRLLSSRLMDFARGARFTTRLYFGAAFMLSLKRVATSSFIYRKFTSSFFRKPR